ncbi:hypothetical protein M1D80_08295 [Phyllobacteriaceae bacterium JZ32]
MLTAALILQLQEMQLDANNHPHEQRAHYHEWLVVGPLTRPRSRFARAQRDQGRNGVSGRPFCLTVRSSRQGKRNGVEDNGDDCRK